MKILAAIITFIVFTGCYGQTDTITTRQALSPKKLSGMKLNLRMYYISPDGTGNNLLSKAHRGVYGIGFKVNVFQYANFNVGAGYEFSQYEVTDVSLAGNVQNTNFYMPFAEVMYAIPVGSRFTLHPKIQLGAGNLSQKTGSRDYGKTDGLTIGAGFYADYTIAKYIDLFAGLNYSFTKVNVKTNADYEDFYNRLTQLNIMAGLKVDILN